ncbi:MAG: hypothetical protein ACOCRN_03420 [Spirochaetia bacterium]
MTLRYGPFAVAAVLSFCVSVYAPAADPALLGADPPEVVDTLGSPSRVYVAESDQVELSTVVFFYDDFRYLYFHDNRVWQIRYDERSSHTIMDLELGMERREVVSLLGPPVARDGNSATFELDDRGFPARLRVFFEADTLIDVYMYRSDY